MLHNLNGMTAGHWEQPFVTCWITNVLGWDVSDKHGYN